MIGDRVVFATATELVCLDRATGKSLWRVPAPIVLKGPAGIAVSLVLSDRAAYLADSAQLRAFRLADGQALWATPATINHHKPPDVFLANGLVWAAAYDASTGRPAPALGLTRMGVNGFDPESGKLVKQIDQTMAGPMGHDRCYRNRITTRYYINTVTGGSDFLGLEFPGGVSQSLDPQHLRHWSAPVQRPLLRRSAVLRVLQQRHAQRPQRDGGGAGLHQIGPAHPRGHGSHARKRPRLR